MIFAISSMRLPCIYCDIQLIIWHTCVWVAFVFFLFPLHFFFFIYFLLCLQKDLVIYEMNVRAFTVDKSSGLDPSIRGSYLGVIEKVMLNSIGNNLRITFGSSIHCQSQWCFTLKFKATINFPREFFSFCCIWMMCSNWKFRKSFCMQCLTFLLIIVSSNHLDSQLLSCCSYNIAMSLASSISFFTFSVSFVGDAH